VPASRRPMPRWRNRAQGDVAAAVDPVASDAAVCGHDLVAGPGVVGPGVPVVHAEGEQLELDGAGAPAAPGGEDRSVVGEHRRWNAQLSDAEVEGLTEPAA